MMVDVAFDLVYFFQYAQTALNGRADFQADAARQCDAQRRAGIYQRARTRHLKPHEGFPLAGNVAGRDLPFGHAVALHFVLRQVDAILAPVDFHVLPKIDQLQAGADVVRMLEVLIGCGTESLQ
jgi:hypothetical protein